MFKNVINTPGITVQRARELRRKQTRAETILWRRLRANALRGLKFRRQVPLGPFIADFFCVEATLIVELDGNSHYQDGAAERDAKRSAFLRKHGLHLIRFNNVQVMDNIDWVLETIAGVAQARSAPLPGPLPEGEGDYRRRFGS